MYRFLAILYQIIYRLAKMYLKALFLVPLFLAQFPAIILNSRIKIHKIS